VAVPTVSELTTTEALPFRGLGTPTRRIDTMSATLPQSVRAFFDGTETRDAALAVSGFTADTVYIHPVGAPTLTGADAVQAEIENLFRPWRHFDGITPEEAFRSGSTTAVVWQGNGIGANGRDITFRGVTTFELTEDGHVAELVAVFDMAALGAQLSA
jgi:ketosteroid isomerase-like protein